MELPRRGQRGNEPLQVPALQHLRGKQRTKYLPLARRGSSTPPGLRLHPSFCERLFHFEFALM